jgi:hypothetical protein
MPKDQIHEDQLHAIGGDNSLATINASVEASLQGICQRGLVPIQRRWLRTPAAARYLGYDEATLLQMRAHKRGPNFRRCGSRILYDVRDLDAFVESHPLVQPEPQP